MILLLACIGVASLIGAAVVCGIIYLANIDGRLR